MRHVFVILASFLSSAILSEAGHPRARKVLESFDYANYDKHDKKGGYGRHSGNTRGYHRGGYGGSKKQSIYDAIPHGGYTKHDDHDYHTVTESQLYGNYDKKHGKSGYKGSRGGYGHGGSKYDHRGGYSSGYGHGGRYEDKGDGKTDKGYDDYAKSSVGKGKDDYQYSDYDYNDYDYKDDKGYDSGKSSQYGKEDKYNSVGYGKKTKDDKSHAQYNDYHDGYGSSYGKSHEQGGHLQRKYYYKESDKKHHKQENAYEEHHYKKKGKYVARHVHTYKRPYVHLAHKKIHEEPLYKIKGKYVAHIHKKAHSHSYTLFHHL